MNSGVFVISLDFELHWGVSDRMTVNDYKENLDNSRQAIRQMLLLFDQYDIHVTWAIVGLLFCKNKEEILSRTRNIEKPCYQKSKFSNYNLISEIGSNYIDDPYHYGNDMISLIKTYPNQEIGTHTFSHYYCLENGASLTSFADDLDAAIAVASDKGIKISSIVFPRNQYSEEHLNICEAKGISSYRGNPNHWLFKPTSIKDQHLVRRFGRLLDSYINLSGMNSSEFGVVKTHLINVPASRFLRPYHPKFSSFESYRLKRIKEEMGFAAQRRQLYHLWWHPHNFGKNLMENITFLKRILDHYQFLKEKHFFSSLNMFELSLK
ncbi:MAG TPA: hypothetical protein VGQ09_21010 [Chitinophagaceae bacterium]|jgi:hypothetical protein|nr:hypothetical protein [Chitinophagaceae bacterium]